MQEFSREEFIGQLHATPQMAVLATTGGGSRAISDLLAAPGASRTVLAAFVPYAASALAEFLDGEPERYCSEHTARMLAAAAREGAANPLLKGVGA